MKSYVQEGLEQGKSDAVKTGNFIIAGVYGATALLTVVTVICMTAGYQSSYHLVSCFKHLFGY